jgi:hypothetical protein
VTERRVSKTRVAFQVGIKLRKTEKVEHKRTADQDTRVAGGTYETPAQAAKQADR